MRFPREATLQRAQALVASFGAGVAGYIAIADAGGGCQTVAESSYSHLVGLNIAIFGIAGYLLLLAFALPRGDGARFAGFGLALFGFGVSVFLTYIELFKIEAICEWCIASAGLMTIALALTATRVIGYVGSEHTLGES
jgi:uncharacterized membrane protein